jgi:hypothetical protein
MMARSTTTLQSEAGYIDARPQSRQIDENLLRRTAEPYIWVNCVIPDDTRTRRLDLNERTWKLASNAAGQHHPTLLPAARSGRTLSAGELRIQRHYTARKMLHFHSVDAAGRQIPSTKSTQPRGHPSTVFCAVRRLRSRSGRGLDCRTPLRAVMGGDGVLVDPGGRPTEPRYLQSRC